MGQDINNARKQSYARSSPMAVKFLQPNGTVTSAVNLGSGGIQDAPIDGNLYGRKDATWAEIPSYEGIDDAPIDGNMYGRQDGAWVRIPDTTQPTGVLFPARINGVAALTHEMPTISQSVTDRTWINANWGEWTDIVTFVSADDVVDKEVEFIPGNRFYGRLWISSDIERPNAQLRLRITDADDGTELVVATTTVNLLNINSIHTPATFNSKHLQLRVMHLSRVRVTLQAMVLAQGIQIGIVSNVPNELSYLTVTSYISDEDAELMI